MLEGAIGAMRDHTRSKKTSNSPYSNQYDYEDECTRKCRAGFLFLLAGFWMFGIPFISALYGSPNPSEFTEKPAIVYFAVMGLFIFIALAAAMYYKDRRVCRLRRPIVRFTRPTVQNFLAFIYLLAEALQLLCLTLSAAASTGLLSNEKVRQLFQFSFFLFGDSWTSDNLAFGAYLSLAIMVVHFLLVAMPIVTGYLLEWDDAQVSRSPIWLSSVSLLSFLTQLTVTRNIAEVLSCKNGRSTYVFINGYSATGEQHGKCWEGQHYAISVTMMVFGVFYLPSSLSRSGFFDESLSADVDVVFTQLYRMLTGTATVIATVMTALHPENGASALVAIIVCSLFNVLVSLLYPSISKPNDAESIDAEESNSDQINDSFVTYNPLRIGRIAVYLGSAICSIIFIAKNNNSSDDNKNPEDLTPFYACVGVMAGCYLLSIIGSVFYETCCRRYAEDDTLDSVREQLLQLESQLVETKKMNLTWVSNDRSAWDSYVKSANRVSTLALATAKIEENMSLLKVTTEFLRTKPRWKSDLSSLIDKADAEDDTSAIINSIKRRDGRYCFGDVEQDCLCCDDGSSRHYGRRHFNIEDDFDIDAWAKKQKQDLNVLERVVQTLHNAASDTGASHLSTYDFDDDDKNDNNSTNNKPSSGTATIEITSSKKKNKKSEMQEALIDSDRKFSAPDYQPPLPISSSSADAKEQHDMEEAIKLSLSEQQQPKKEEEESYSMPGHRQETDSSVLSMDQRDDSI